MKNSKKFPAETRKIRSKTICEINIEKNMYSIPSAYIQETITIFNNKIKRPFRKPKIRNNTDENNLQDGTENLESVSMLLQDIQLQNITEDLDSITDIEEIKLGTPSDEEIYIKKEKNRKRNERKERKRKLKAIAKENCNKSTNVEKPLTNEKTESTDGSPKKKKKKKNVNNKFPNYFPSDYIQNALNGTYDDGLKYVVGSLRINPRYYRHAFVTVEDEDDDVLIDGLLDRNRALEGDIVVAVLRPEAEWVKDDSSDITKRTGVVIFILEYIHTRDVIGFIKVDEDKIFLYPRDTRLPKLKLMPTSIPPKIIKNIESYKDHLFMASIIQWVSLYNAIGKFVKIIGQKGNLDVETDAILLQNNLNVSPIPDEVLKELPTSDYILTTEDLKDREDWRKSCVFTIDPATAVDLDDAVSCRLLYNGNYEVGVHISDVTHFLDHFSLLDEIVAKRATTVYLVNNVFHMLPKQLCNLCSLLPGCDKLAFSVIWEMTPDAKPIKHRFAKTVINSCCQLSYDIAQCIIDDPVQDQNFTIHGNFTYEQIAVTVKHLQKLAVQMRQRRFQDGALCINRSKLHIKLDPVSEFPLSYKVDEMKPSNRLIEEFMLLANMTVAEQIFKKLPELSLLRSHKEPSSRKFKKTCDILKELGVFLDYQSAGTLNNSMNKYRPSGMIEFGEKKLADECRMMVIDSLCAKSMTRATYICSNNIRLEKDLKHYALNAPFYTHFTSPIRRYPDVIVHRLLYASMNKEPMSEKWNSALCKSVAENCNLKKYSAKLAQEQSNELYFTYLLQMTKAMNVIGVVAEVKDSKLEVLLYNIGIKINIYFSDIKQYASVDYSIVNSIPTAVIKWNNSEATQEVKIFTILNLEIYKHPEQYRVLGKILPAQETESEVNIVHLQDHLNEPGLMVQK